MLPARAAGLAVILALGAGASGRAEGFAPHPAAGAPQFASVARTSFYVPLRDGAQVAVDLYRPIRDGRPVETPLPVIWQATNDRSSSSSIGGDGGELGLKDAPRLARYGYVVAIADRRGIGASSGTRRGYHDRTEDFDSYEITEWLARQPWSDGKVGLYGCSNTGEAVMHAVSTAPPHLKAAFAGCFSWNKYDGMARGGLFANWGTGPERTFDQDMGLRPVDGDPDRVQLRRAAEDHRANTVLRDLWAQMPFRDSYSPLVASRFWSEGSVSSYADQVRRAGVPIYMLDGWWDDFRGQVLTAWANLPEGRRRVLIGPWRHCRNEGFDLLAEMRRFFDLTLKGVDDDGFAGEAPIHYYTVNAPPGHEWRATDRWPVAGMHPQTFYLGAGGALSSAQTGASAARTTFAVRYDVDCIRGGKTEPLTLGTMVTAQPCPMAKAGPQYSTAPMARDVELTGSPAADIWITADQPDANLFLYLEDVGPDGAGTPISDARLKASLRKTQAAPWATTDGPWHRAYAEDAAPLRPGEPAQLTMAFLPVSYVVKAGHTVRLTIAGADFRERNRTPAASPALISILSGGAAPSTISLPVVTEPTP